MQRLRLALSCAFVWACGGNDDKPCDPVANTGCDNGQVCEVVTGEDTTPQCFAPLEVRGKVIDLADSKGIAGARVVAVDVNGAAVSGVATSAADGTYAVVIPATRNADGTLATPFAVSLRADAATYQSFPGVVRQALPIDLAAATAGDNGGQVVQSALTDIGLIKDGAAGPGSITGKVDVPADHAGVLVVAEAAGKGSAVIAARDGAYTIFNLAAGHYTVSAYSVGHVYGTAEVDVTAETKADLALTADMPGSIAGQVSIVDGGGGTATSVVAFVESTFDPVTGRGVPPPGLRAGNVSGAFTLENTPPGKYVIVAAFENDGLVRDPDHCISGTADVHVTVGAGQAVTAPTTFKVTGALAVMSPGATMIEAVTGAPTFKWADDSSEDTYLVEVFDAFGQKVYSKSIPGVSGGTPQVAYDGPALTSGMFYQWRATSLKMKTGSSCELSRTEDLKGVFFVP